MSLFIYEDNSYKILKILLVHVVLRLSLFFCGLSKFLGYSLGFYL